MISSASLLAACVLVQSKPQPQRLPTQHVNLTSWALRPLLPGPSKEWQAARRRGDSLVARVRGLAPDAQAKAVQAVVDKIRDSREITEEYYQASLLRYHFPAAWRRLRPYRTVEAEVQFQFGQADPEYARALYLALSPGNASSDYWKMGVQLMRIFPKDMDLVQAFVVDAYAAPQALAQVDLAMPLIAKTAYSDISKHRMRARMLWARSRYTLRRSDVRKAIEENESVLKRNVPARERSNIEWVIEDLKKRLTDPKYKEG